VLSLIGFGTARGDEMCVPDIIAKGMPVKVLGITDVALDPSDQNLVHLRTSPFIFCVCYCTFLHSWLPYRLLKRKMSATHSRA
jgi:hypothetical protein